MHVLEAIINSIKYIAEYMPSFFIYLDSDGFKWKKFLFGYSKAVSAFELMKRSSSKSSVVR